MSDSEDGWFADVPSDDPAAAAAAVREGSAAAPAAWPERAVAAGFADDEADYYDRLREATTTAARTAVREREGADDRRLVHAIRATIDEIEHATYASADPVPEKWCFDYSHRSLPCGDEADLDP